MTEDRRIERAQKHRVRMYYIKSIACMLALILMALAIEVAIINTYIHKNARNTSSMLLDRVRSILVDNAQQEEALLAKLKEDYIDKAKAVAFCIDQNRNLASNVVDLEQLADMLGIDEINIFDKNGIIVRGTVPRYYGYGFSSGEQMSYFTPMLEDTTLAMCQDVTPNTVDGKRMMYAITWNTSGSYMVQVGVKQLRLIEELRHNEAAEVLANIPSYSEIDIYVIDAASDAITGCTNDGKVGMLAADTGLSLADASEDETIVARIEVDNADRYCAYRRAGESIVAVTYSTRSDVNGTLIAVGVEAVYLLIIGAFIFFILHRLRSAVLKERERERELEDAAAEREAQLEEITALNAQLRSAQEAAESASAAKTTFLFNMSHDIRTPMNAILGYADVGCRHIGDEAIVRDSLRKIKTAGAHLLNLINEVLEMSRIEAGRMELVGRAMDIRQAVRGITEMSRALATSKSIDYETVMGDIRNPYIFADELHTNEVIINLISNAVKYTPEGGKVRYTINQLGDVSDGRVAFRFEVSDNGIGMSEEFQQHLFENFSREANTTISKTEGAGLGLAIVKRIIDLAGGKIYVRSAKGQGTTFAIEMSFRALSEDEIKALRAEDVPEDVPIEDASLAGKRVLLAEDNDLNRELATFLLEDAGFIVESAADGKEAADAVARQGVDYYDIILMDIQMPVMNGYEATRAIRALPGGERVPIIALSANAFEEDKEKSYASGMNAHVAKPIDARVLLDAMQSVARR